MFENILLVSAVLLAVFLSGIRILRPTHRGVVETMGKYTRFANPGFQWVVPVIQKLHTVETTEMMMDMQPQEIITEDNLNAQVDMVIYYQVKKDEESVKRAFYEVNNVNSQIVVLAQTTARNIIGGMPFKDVNSKRQTLNVQLAEILRQETQKWGVEVVRVELKEIIPPRDVQETMNQVIKAENSKRSAVDFATAQETQADGTRRAAIKEAEGEKQAAVLKAQGQAAAFDLVNKSFTGNAQLLKKLEVTEKSLASNAKIILTDKGISPQIILGEIPISAK